MMDSIEAARLMRTFSKAKQNNRIGHVYVIQSSDKKKVKIGKSRKPEDRIKQIRTMAGGTGCTFISDEVTDMAAIESAIHKSLVSLRLVGEWFSCGFDEAVLTVKSMCADFTAAEGSEIDNHEDLENEDKRLLTLLKLFESTPGPDVDARTLHAHIGTSTEFSTWIKSKIDRYNPTQGCDYLQRPQGIITNAGTVQPTEYTLSSALARAICLWESKHQSNSDTTTGVEIC